MKAGKIILLTVAWSFLLKATGQSAPSPVAFKTLNVANGLPQSYISGLVQDGTGFIWIGTRDGLARYDGRRFKYFRHIPGDTATLADNIITNLYLDKENRLWIYFEAGDVDLLNTATEELFHLTNDPVFAPMNASLKGWQSVTEDAEGAFWLVRSGGTGVFICRPSNRTLRFFSVTDLGLPEHKIASLARSGSNVVLLTNRSIVTLTKDRKIVRVKPYPFTAALSDFVFTWKTIPLLVRKNGDVVIHEKSSLLIYSPVSDSLRKLPMLPEKNPLNFCMAQDDKGQVFFEHEYALYTLSPQNKLSLWQSRERNPPYGFKSMLVDRSGVLWLGSNGSGIQLYDLRLPRLGGIAYKKRFHEDVLETCLQVPDSELAATTLHGEQSYYIRWTKGVNNDYWIARAGSALSEQAEVYHCAAGHLTTPRWHYTDTLKAGHAQINCLALSTAGELWGIDFYLRPVQFNTVSHAVTVFPSIASVDTSYSFTTSGLVIDKRNVFWISTALNGLFSYDALSRKAVHYAAGNSVGSLPTNQLMNIVEDPDDADVLWIGSLGGGLVKFSKATGRCRIFTTAQGLPNNTVYAVVIDAKGALWCSSNKGIFSFDRKTGAVLQSFTSKDGLPGDEFNRYHYFQLPDGRVSFGGVDGYTVFNPLSVANDDYKPVVALTGITVNNAPADFGQPASPLTAPINNLNEIVLPHTQNFLTFDFAALQYNITEKLQYRYVMEGFDETWVMAGNGNTAVYTKLPPGRYTFKINATNTAGKWSDSIKTIRVVITPPFWLTWWFIALLALTAFALLYFIIQYRISNIKKDLQQKMQFRREASELRAQALRAQMNPHFVFNSLNSIKSLIQEDKKKEAVVYLTTFSKLIRAQLNNAEQAISLHDELETCKLYAQLEALRFGDKIVCEFTIDESIDTHSLKVPPLLLQPFIENAIWHGILPRQSGKVTVSVVGENGSINCLIDDNGIGRELAMRNKSKTSSTYASKGMKLVKNRLNLFNIIHKQGGSVEVIDKRDKQENPAGTLVVIKFKRQA